MKDVSELHSAATTRTSQYIAFISRCSARVDTYLCVSCGFTVDRYYFPIQH